MKHTRWMFCLVLICALAAPLMAQTFTLPRSSLSLSTMGLFGSDVDSFLNTNHYSSVEMDKALVFAGLWRNTLEAGWAQKFGDFYVGAYYDGAIFDAAGNKVENETKETEYVFENGLMVGPNTLTTRTVSGDADTYNNAGVLIGFSGMGIRLGFEEDSTTYYNPNRFTTPVPSTIRESNLGKTVVTDEYTNVNNVTGNIRPSIAWGMNFPVADMTVRPFAEVELGFLTDKNEYRRVQNTKDNGIVRLSTDNITTDYASDYGYFDLGAKIGADLDFAENDGLAMTAGLAYEIIIPIYGAAYGETTRTNTVNTTLAGKTTTNIKNVNAPVLSGSDHYITPQFTVTKEIERLSLGLNVKMGLGFGNYSNAAKRVVTTTTDTVSNSGNPGANTYRTVTATTSGRTRTTDAFNFDPELNAGIRFKVGESERLTLNAGLGIQFPRLSVRTVKNTGIAETVTVTKTTDGFGNVITNTTTTDRDDTFTNDEETGVTTTSWTALRANFGLGFTFNFTDNFVFDAYYAINDATNFALINFLDANIAMQVTYKF